MRNGHATKKTGEIQCCIWLNCVVQLQQFNRAKETSRLNDYHAQLDLHGNVDGSYTISMLILWKPLKSIDIAVSSPVHNMGNYLYTYIYNYIYVLYIEKYRCYTYFCMFPQKNSRTTTSGQPDVRETLRKIRLVEPLIVLAVVVVRSLVETIKKGRVQLSHTPKFKGNLWKIVFAIAVLVCDPQFWWFPSEHGHQLMAKATLSWPHLCV